MEVRERFSNELASIREDGLYKEERIITSAQSARIQVSGGTEVLNFCANNYLGLANHAEVIAAAEILEEEFDMEIPTSAKTDVLPGVETAGDIVELIDRRLSRSEP